MLRDDLESYLSNLLSINEFDDYCPNGLQIEGAVDVNKVICGVTASQSLIDLAIQEKANAIIVHHGYFWKGEDSAIRAIKKNRIKSLLLNDISLFAYHLPLDAHPVYGNNAQLAQLLSLAIEKPMEMHGKHALGLVCELKEAQKIEDFSKFASKQLKIEVKTLGPAGKDIKRVALCTGAAQSMFESAIINHNIDAYLTGEVSEPSFHLANEYDCNFLALGHHASERYGAKAIAQHLREKFALDSSFVDLPNPI